jgi:zinc transport system ATP-binding protein
MSVSVLSAEGLAACYDGRRVIEDIDLEVPQGDFLALIGPNGGGKTTLLKVALGLIPPMSGSVQLFGQAVSKGRTKVGYVPQAVEFDREFPIRVNEVVRMGRLGVGDPGRDKQAVAEALERVEMTSFAKRPIGALSGGQRQRVFLARALAAEPSALFLDEPTAHLDPEISAEVYALLRRINDENGVTILLTTHDVGVVSSFAKRVGCVGRRLFMGEDGGLTQELLDHAYGSPVRVMSHHHDHGGHNHV